MAEIGQGRTLIPGHDGSARRKEYRPPKPLDQTRLEEMALAYVARFATSAANLERYILRKLRERGWHGEGQPDPAALVARYVELGYVDDEAFARGRSSSLLRRGYGPRRIGQALGEAGIDMDIYEDLAPSEAGKRGAALALAKKRRFGPFGADAGDQRDPRIRQKQIAAMLRAGHMFDDTRAIIDAPDATAAERWVAASEDKD